MFQPSVGDKIELEGVLYTFAAHPAMPRMPYGQEGRQAVVYKLDTEVGSSALKVFKPRYRKPYLVRITRSMSAFSDLPGMEVCHRRVLYAERHLELIRDYPELAYAALMPWIEGPTWIEVLLSRERISAETSLKLARSFLTTLVALEEEGLSHGDISASNIMLPFMVGGEGISLVDVEQLYVPGTERPEIFSDGSPGYRFPASGHQSSWSPLTDRFPGSIILCEMLCFSNERVVLSSHGESFFSDEEVGTECPRMNLMLEVLSDTWSPKLASLLRRNWHADTLEECSPFIDWLINLPDSAPESLRRTLTQLLSSPERIRLPLRRYQPRI